MFQVYFLATEQSGFLVFCGIDGWDRRMEGRTDGGGIERRVALRMCVSVSG